MWNRTPPAATTCWTRMSVARNYGLSLHLGMLSLLPPPGGFVKVINTIRLYNFVENRDIFLYAQFCESAIPVFSKRWCCVRDFPGGDNTHIQKRGCVNFNYALRHWRWKWRRRGPKRWRQGEQRLRLRSRRWSPSLVHHRNHFQLAAARRLPPREADPRAAEIRHGVFLFGRNVHQRNRV